MYPSPGVEDTPGADGAAAGRAGIVTPVTVILGAEPLYVPDTDAVKFTVPGLEPYEPEEYV
jgi:hypothetical protein